MSVPGNERAGVKSQVLQMFRKSDNYGDCGSGWLLLGVMLEKRNEKLKMLSHRFKATCEAQRASLAAYGTENLLQPENRKMKNQAQD